MDTQTIFNLIVGLVAFSGGYILNSITKSIDRLDKEMRELPRMYVSKDDYHRDIDEIKDMCKQIMRRIDEKVDRV